MVCKSWFIFMFHNTITESHPLFVETVILFKNNGEFWLRLIYFRKYGLYLKWFKVNF